MGPTAQRIAGAVGAVAVAAVVNIATGVLAEKQDLAWWASGAALLVVGVLIQWRLPVAAPPEGERRRQSVRDTKVGGSVRQRTDGPAAQETTGSDIGGDLSQEQHG